MDQLPMSCKHTMIQCPAEWLFRQTIHSNLTTLRAIFAAAHGLVRSAGAAWRWRCTALLARAGTSPLPRPPPAPFGATSTCRQAGLARCCVPKLATCAAAVGLEWVGCAAYRLFSAGQPAPAGKQAEQGHACITASCKHDAHQGRCSGLQPSALLTGPLLLFCSSHSSWWMPQCWPPDRKPGAFFSTPCLEQCRRLQAGFGVACHAVLATRPEARRIACWLGCHVTWLLLHAGLPRRVLLHAQLLAG